MNHASMKGYIIIVCVVTILFVGTLRYLSEVEMRIDVDNVNGILVDGPPLSQDTISTAEKVSSIVKNRSHTHTAIHTCRFDNTTVRIPTIPNFVIIGAQKAGTSSMADYLVQHPQILPKREPNKRECHFFNNPFAGMWQHYQQGSYNHDTENEFYCRARQTYANLYFHVDKHMQNAQTTPPSVALQSSTPAPTPPLYSFDKTPRYIHEPNCWNHLRKTCPWESLKIIVMLRNPVDRAWSQHQMDSGKRNMGTFEDRINREIKSLNEKGFFKHIPLIQVQPNNNMSTSTPPFDLIRISHEKEEQILFFQTKGMPLLKKGLYSIQLRPWLRSFSPKNIHIIQYERLKADPDTVFRKVLKFLQMDDHSLKEYPKSKEGTYNKSVSMSDSTRRYLETLYRPFNQDLAEMLGEEWVGVWNE